MSLRDRLVTVGVLVLLALFAFLVLRGRRTNPLIRLIIFARYPLLAALLQLGLAALGFWDSPGVKSFVGNVFVLDANFQLCQVTWMSFLLATACIVMYRTVKISAPERFRDYRRSIEQYVQTVDSQGGPHGLWDRFCYSLLHTQTDTRNVWGKRWIYLLVLALPVPLAAFYTTRADMLSVLPPNAPSGSVDFGLAIWMAIGILVWLALMGVTTLVQQLFVDKQATDFGLFPLDVVKLVPSGRRARLQSAARPVANGIARLGPGFSERQPGGGRLLPGHGQLAAYTLILGIVYAVSVIFFSDPTTHFPWPWLPIQDPLFPTLFSVQTMILMSALVVSGAAFFFDYWRIPIVVILLAVSILAWKLTRADSFYEVQQGIGVAVLAPNALEFPTVTDGKRTLVVVTAAGGGIQASAWTAEVLTGLHEQYKNKFTRSIGVISAVSGGSVGAMFVLDPWQQNFGGLPENDPDAIAGIRFRAARSSLEATAQLWSGWDLVKTLAPFLAPKFKDRGWAIERSWSRGMTDKNATLSKWGQLLNEHHFPIVAFNATDVETGARFVVCNALLPDPNEGFNLPTKLPQCNQFFAPGTPTDLKALTGARLSATFPYVSPICRAPDTPADHVADGGYIDNEGLFSAMQWLKHLLIMRQNGQTKFDRVLILRIVPFPPSNDKQKLPQLGWVYAFSGPLQAMLNVRDASQISRNLFDLGLLKKAFDAPANAPNVNDGKVPVEIVDCQFSATNEPNERPPLSWKLSRHQQHAIQDGWKTIKGNVFKKLDPWFQ